VKNLKTLDVMQVIIFYRLLSVYFFYQHCIIENNIKQLCIPLFQYFIGIMINVIYYLVPTYVVIIGTYILVRVIGQCQCFMTKCSRKDIILNPGTYIIINKYNVLVFYTY